MTSNSVGKVFDPYKSSKAKEMMKMSSRELFERYFVVDNKVSWIVDLNREKNATKFNNPEKDAYPLIISIMGQPLNYIFSQIHKKLSPYIPEGYKWNAKAIMTDLEALLAENVKETRRAAVSKETSPYIAEIADFLVKVYDNGIEFTV